MAIPPSGLRARVPEFGGFARDKGEVPKTLNLQYSNSVKSEPLYEDLQAEIGSLSDISVRFTPEYFWRYSWEETPLVGGGKDFSFGLNPGAIELAFLMLSKHHELIIRVFDRKDGRMLRHSRSGACPSVPSVSA